jgi:collagen type VII alpha
MSVTLTVTGSSITCATPVHVWDVHTFVTSGVMLSGTVWLHMSDGRRPLAWQKQQIAAPVAMSLNAGNGTATVDFGTGAAVGLFRRQNEDAPVWIGIWSATTENWIAYGLMDLLWAPQPPGVSPGNTGASGYSGTSGSSGKSGYSGVSGATGAGVLVRGAWDPAISYDNGDVVAHNTYAWISLQDSNLNQEPAAGAWWAKFADQGVSGYSGVSGATGVGSSGYSGTSGATGAGSSGYSGTSGAAGAGTSGYSGVSGAAGAGGSSGYSGVSGAGSSGYSGTSGATGSSGYSGVSGSGGSGYSGVSGAAGSSGYSGTSGVAGAGGSSGYSGVSGAAGGSG